MRPLFLSFACVSSAPAPADGRTDAGWGCVHKSPLFVPEREPFPEKAIQARGESPGILEGLPPIGGAGLGQAGGISLGAQRSN